MRNLLTTLLSITLYVTSHFSLAAFKILCLWLTLSLNIMCLCVTLLEFIFLGNDVSKPLGCLYSCLSSNLECFQSLFLQIFSPLLSSSGPPTMYMLVHLMVSNKSLRLCALFFTFFLCIHQTC